MEVISIIIVAAGTVMSEIGAHSIPHRASITVAGCHGYGRGQGPTTYLTKPALLWFDETASIEVGAHNLFHGGSITVVGWHVYERGRCP